MAAMNLLVVAFLLVSSITVAVHAQQEVVCRASADCNGAVGDDLGVMTIEKCCLETPNALGFSDDESCSACIVYGFLNDSFVGEEQGQGHTVPVGYLKGAAFVTTNLVFTVTSIAGTAREGAASDYTISSSQVRILVRRPTDNVLFIFRMDAIAQEENETLTLKLDPLPSVTPPMGRNVFFKSTIGLTIVDSDEVGIFFTEDDFRTNERNMTNRDKPAFMPVLVTKNSRIANPIVLDVIPLTVGMARTVLSPSDLPENIPIVNPFSPPYADLSDFNNTTIRITFDPDELANDDERAAPIRIFNDAVNEANEQVFVVQLSLINSTNASSVILDTRPASLCRIIDDDIIRIGFEEKRYTYLEPKFDDDVTSSTFMLLSNSTAHGPIYLAKEDNVQSEQTFRIIVQVADSVPAGEVNLNPATRELDYSIGGASTAVVEFRPIMQKVNLPLSLVSDKFPEGTEVFRASSSAEDTAQVGDMEFDLPDYLPPIGVFAETVVIINDDDPIIIGFEETNYTVNESMGALEVYVSVISPPADVELFASIDLVIQSVSRTATGDIDYEEIDLLAFDVLLEFDNNNRRQSFSVTINDDELLEFMEDFNLELRFDTFGVSAPSGVELSPNVSTVYIVDDDVATIGFIRPPYSVNENGGQVLIPVGVLSGTLEREVVVSFSTSDSTAIVGNDYNQVQNMLLTFGPNSNRTDIPVTIIDDNVYERTDKFSGILSFSGDPIPGVTLSPVSTNITILDDDELKFGFEPVDYTVSEGAGPVALGIVFSGNAGELVPHVITSTTDGTATGSGVEADYTPVVPQAFSFTDSDRNLDLNIDIVSDTFTEYNETFSAMLDSVFLATQPNGQPLDLSVQERARLILDPDTASVTIFDDDEAVIGFLNTVLSIREDGGTLDFNVGVTSGTLRINVTVNFVTNDGTARSGQDYMETATSLVIFDQSSQSVPVTIITDDLFETPESFFGLLSSDSELPWPPNVQLAPTRATATIIDVGVLIIGFEPATYEVNENGGTVTLTVRVLNGTISEGRNIPIRVTTAGDSAQAPADYANISQEVTFSSTSIEQTVVVDIVADDLLEIDEVFTAMLEFVNGNDAASSRILLQPAEASITILDDDMAVIGFDPVTYNVIEGVNSLASLSVSLLSGTLGRDVTVFLNTQSGTATSGLDFTGIASQQLVFSPTVSMVTVSVDITDDNFLETSPETFTANLVSTVRRLSLSPDEATVNIADDDSVTFGFDRAQYSVIESDLFANVTIRQVSGATLNRNVHITLNTTDGTAISSGERDFVAHSVDLTFGPGNTEQTVMIAIIDDRHLEHDEEFNSIVSLTSADSSVDLNPADASISIIDNDMVVIGFNQTVYEVREDVGQAIVYVVLRNGILRREVVVEFSTVDDTAQDGSDYTGVVQRLLTFDMNNSEFPILIDILDDNIHELDERFIGNLSTGDEDAILEPDQTTVRILNNDVVTFTFRQPMHMLLENAEMGRVCVDKIGDTDQDITVSVKGEIQSGPFNRILVFPSNLNSSCIDFAVDDDNIALELPEEFTWTLDPVPIPGVNLGINTTRIVIVDDDRLILNLTKSGDIPESIGTARACIIFSNPFARPFEISPSVGRPPNNSVAELATPRMDYNDTIPTITPMPGDNETCFDIIIIDDNLVEEDRECFMVSFTVEDLDGLVIGNSSALCCIIDDDNVTIGFRPVDYTVNENQGTVTIFVQLLDGLLARPVEVDFTTEDGTATSIAPADYVSPALPITLQFTPNHGDQEVAVTIVNDDIVENTETFAGILSTIDRAVILGPNRASVEITEDPNDAVTIGFDPVEYTVSEDAGSVPLTIRMISGVLERDVTVFFETSPGSATSADPADYERTTTLLTFTPTVNNNLVSVTILNDNIHEDSEVFFAQLDAQGEPVITSPDVATVMIIDDSDSIVIGFEMTTYNVSEGEEEDVCAKLISGKLETNVEVSVTSSDVTANADSDYTPVSQALVFNATATTICFPTSSLEDGLLEDDEVYSLTLSQTPIKQGVTLNPSEATVTIVDDDTVTIGLTDTMFEVTEGDGVVVTVCAMVISGELEREAEVILQTVEGSAVSQGIEPDYQALLARLTFTSTMTRICRDITIINDVFYEDPENFNVLLTTEDTDVVVNPDMGTITILDGDTVVIGFVQSTYIALENQGSQTVCAELRSGTLRTNVTVQFSTSDGDATAPEDYTETTMSFVFNNSQQQNCIDITIVPDNIIEGVEKFSGNLATTALRVTLMPGLTEISIRETLPLEIGFVDEPYETHEESGFATVSVAILSQNVRLDDDFVVRLRSADLPGIGNSATAGADYQPATVDLTFNSVVKRIDLNLTIIDDDIVESNEVFSVDLTIVTMGPGAPEAVVDPADATVTILDEEDTITIGLTETLITVNESVGMRQVCATVLDGDLGRRAEATLNLHPRTAMSGDDYEMVSFVLLFDATNMGPICNSVVVRDDNVYEFEEELTFNLTTSDQSVVLEPAGGVLVIEDDDEIVIGWDQVLYEVDESIGRAVLCASVIQGSLAVTLPALNIATRDGSASHSAPQDYIPSLSPNQFVFSTTNDDTSVCTNIPIVDDPVLELDENFYANLSFSVAELPDRVTVSPAATEVMILDDDPVVIGFQQTTYSVLEGAGDAVLEVGIITGSLETDIVVRLTTADDSAVSPNDYASKDQVLTFSSSVARLTVPVSIVDDVLDEIDSENFTALLVRVTDISRVTIDPDLAEVTIEDNDVVQIGFEQTTYFTTENNTREVTVCASIQSGSPSLSGKSVVVALMSVDGSAIAPRDYNAVSTTLTFDKDTNRNCVTFTGAEDDVVDPNENFTVTLTGGDDVILTPDTAVVTIVDQISIVVGFVERMYTFIENSGAGTIQVRKNEVSNVPFQVRVFGGPSTSSPIHQSALAVDQTITFGAGPSAPDVIPVQININDDDIALEAIEIYDVNLEIVGSPTNIVIGRHEMTTVNVLDEDLVTVGFGSSGVTVNESSGEFRMCVVKDRVAVQDVTVTIVSQHDTASPNLDYNPSGIPGTVTILASDPRACFTGPIIDDLVALEPDETFSLRISNISPDTNRIQRGIETTRITITDDDFVSVKFEEPNYVFREESGLATVCLVKDLETAADFDVETVTSDNTANDGSDYVGGPFTVNFGTSTNEVQCRQITLISDNEREEHEDFFVDLNIADTGGIRRGNPSRTLVTIEDTGIPVNDTVIGDPLMTVPILVDDEDLKNLNTDRVSLCYEIHGRADTNFNLVTDECATVNAHYTDLTSYLNVIDQIGVRAIDNSGNCRNIQVNVDSCSALIDDVPLATGSKYNFEGISVRRYSNRVRISVPNCNELSLVMWVICETRTIEDPFGVGTVTGNMIKFVVMRGLNFGHRQAHGLLGQFWNVPVTVEPFTGVDRHGDPVPQRYVINITSTSSNEMRSYTGWLYDLTWSFEEGPCLYVGNRQAGPIYEVKDPNDPIIEGRYKEYIVPDLFSEDNFVYGLFDEDNCLSEVTTTEKPMPEVVVPTGGPPE